MPKLPRSLLHVSSVGSSMSRDRSEYKVILVTAGGGVTGSAIVRRLCQDGVEVRALVSGRRNADRLRAYGSDVAVGDIEDDSVVRRALRHISAVYLIVPNFSLNERDVARRVIDLSQDAGVERIIYHSVLRPHIEAMPHHWAKMRVEEYLYSCAVPYTILQPCAYMDNIGRSLDTIISTGHYLSYWGPSAELSLVDLDDVAEAAAVVLLMEGHDHASYELCGPQPLTAIEMARLIGAQLGRSIEVLTTMPRLANPTENEREMYAAQCFRRMCSYYQEHGFKGSDATLRMLLGRQPHTFEEYLSRMSWPVA